MNEQDTDRTFIWVSIMLIVGLFLREVQCHKTLDGNVAIFSASLYRNRTLGSTKHSPTAIVVHGNNVTSNPRRVTKRV